MAINQAHISHTTNHTTISLRSPQHHTVQCVHDKVSNHFSLTNFIPIDELFLKLPNKTPVLAQERAVWSKPT